MGMDVYGKNAKTKKGEYFRNNVWWWHPLWEYCVTTHGEIAGKVDNGHSNDGDGLDAEMATALGVALMSDIESGLVKKYEDEYRLALSELPMPECQWCAGTGIRSDDVGIVNDMPNKELEQAEAIVLGRTHGWCNACKGHGKTLAWSANYPFSTENVQEFAEFLLDCGGFEIC
jgi:hypothetical protein